jgi:hypothetical protein
MMSKEFVVYHMTDTGDFLVEVKRYRYLAYVVRWKNSHPTAKVYVKVKAKGLPATWHRFDGMKLARLEAELVEVLFTVLDSYK